MAQFILNQFLFVQAALGEKRLGINNILIWSIRRDEEGNLREELLLVFAPQPWVQIEPPKKGANQGPGPVLFPAALILPRADPSRLERHCLDFSQDIFIPSV